MNNAEQIKFLQELFGTNEVRPHDINTYSITIKAESTNTTYIGNAMLDELSKAGFKIFSMFVTENTLHVKIKKC